MIWDENIRRLIFYNYLIILLNKNLCHVKRNDKIKINLHQFQTNDRDFV
jgi:hypothetical protein